MASKFVPFVTHAATSKDGLARDRMPKDALIVDVGDTFGARFLDSLLRANRVAFTGTTDMSQGALALPGWVMLDCYLLPSSIVGFAQRAAELPASLFEALAPESGDALVPVAAYTALPTPIPGRFIGISLFSLSTGLRLGLRSKALGLLLYGATDQWGITQFDSPSIRIHTNFGPLRFISAEPPIHTFSHKTFIYRLTVPAPDVLERFAASEKPLPPPTSPPLGEWIATNDDGAMTRLKRQIREAPGRFAAVHPGSRANARGGQDIYVADLGSSA
ncbi:MAG: hypothetical protein IT381_07510 [Deltaproteobacteria bacterium]|nr:hypothetical protein [Deltaproteobacteria bacterium]